MQAVVCEGKGTDMDGYTLSISRCSGGDGVEESFKAKIKRREAALDAFAVAEAYCKGIGMVSRCEREGIQGEIAIRSYDSTGTTIEYYLGNAEEFYPDEHPQILEREVGYIFPLMEVEPTICIELKDEG